MANIDTTKKINKVEINNGTYEIVPHRLTDGTHFANLPTLNKNTTLITEDNIKTINHNSLIGTGDIHVVGEKGDAGISGDLFSVSVDSQGDLWAYYPQDPGTNKFELRENGLYFVIDEQHKVYVGNVVGPQGPQGDTGDSLEYNWQGTSLGVRVKNSGEPFSYVDLKGLDSTVPGPPGPPGKTPDIINDLTTGGADKALSAEQGKVLNENKQPKGNYAVTDNINIFNAPKNINYEEQPTVWFNTANGGRVGFGKEKDNSGTGIFFDQVAGTRRLNFRASATPGAMVWSQPEDDARLFFDVGGDNKRIALPIGPGTIALTKNIPKIENSLTSTSTTAALSAAQGKKLNDEKQVKLISGTNIKTINNTSILGEGNINTPDTNTWRPVYNGLDSTKTDTSLSANMGKWLNDNKQSKGNYVTTDTTQTISGAKKFTATVNALNYNINSKAKIQYNSTDDCIEFVFL